MREMDDLEIKSKIDEISKKIDNIIINIERVDPNKKDPEQKQE